MKALLGVTQRPFFAKLLVDPTNSNAEDVRIAFASFLIKVTKETLYLDLDFQDILHFYTFFGYKSNGC